jgi:hypothetical protein
MSIWSLSATTIRQFGGQKSIYDGYMSPNHTLTVRLSPAQYRTLEQLTKKLNLDKTNVIRLALTRLAEAEKQLPDARL